jgi:hypothetical protein
MEKRRHNRIDLDEKGWRAELIDQVSGNRLGEVVNLSSNGMMLIAHSPIEVDNLYQVECNAHGPDDEIDRFTAGVMVLWTREASQEGTHWAGVQIIDIDGESKMRFLALTAALGDNCN